MPRRRCGPSTVRLPPRRERVDQFHIDVLHIASVAGHEGHAVDDGFAERILAIDAPTARLWGERWCLEDIECPQS
jgi:hypothetical protein